MFYALARNGLAPKPLARTHSKFKTPNVAIIWMTVFAIVLSLLFGWKWGALIGFSFIATLAVPLVILVYMLICLGCMCMYLTKMRAKFNPLLHLVLPIARDRPVLLPALLPVLQGAADQADPVRELGRDRLDDRRHRRSPSSSCRLRPSKLDDLDRVYVAGRHGGTATRRTRLRADGMMAAWR